jgi:glycosyltransferase involved in cell wall biosynthesis
MTAPKVLVITPDRLGKSMAGPAIRAKAIADELAGQNPTCLLSLNEASEIIDSKATVAISDHKKWVRWADIVIYQGIVLEHFRLLRKRKKYLIADMYDPLHIEYLGSAVNTSFYVRRAVLSVTAASIGLQLRVSDLVLAASKEQKDLWLSHMAAWNVIDPEEYDKDPELKSHLAIVPFGISNQEPKATKNPYLKNFSNIKSRDPILLWGGGIYDWFDPLTLIKAVAIAIKKKPNLRLVFMGGKHPNPDVPLNKIVKKSIDLATELALLNKNVFFNENWIDYEKRANYLKHATIGVSIHTKSLETQFSFRTRNLDYLWAGLPIITTEGDFFSRLVQEKNLGMVVPQKDEVALAKAIIDLLDTKKLKVAQKNSLAAREEFRWKAVTEPIKEYCLNPYRTKKNPLALKRQPRKTPVYYYKRFGEIKREEGLGGIFRKTAKKLRLPGSRYW